MLLSFPLVSWVEMENLEKLVPAVISVCILSIHVFNATWPLKYYFFTMIAIYNLLLAYVIACTLV